MCTYTLGCFFNTSVTKCKPFHKISSLSSGVKIILCYYYIYSFCALCISLLIAHVGYKYTVFDYFSKFVFYFFRYVCNWCMLTDFSLFNSAKGKNKKNKKFSIQTATTILIGVLKAVIIN